MCDLGRYAHTVHYSRSAHVVMWVQSDKSKMANAMTTSDSSSDSDSSEGISDSSDTVVSLERRAIQPYLFEPPAEATDRPNLRLPRRNVVCLLVTCLFTLANVFTPCNQVVS